MSELNRNQAEEKNPLQTNSRRINVLTRAILSPEFFGLVLVLFVTAFPPFDILTETNLSIHMLQHVLITLGGVIVAYSMYKKGKFDKIKSTGVGLVGFSVIAALLVFWHLPIYWDAAVLNPLVHLIEHTSFLLIGLLIGSCLPMLPDNFKMLILVLAISAHMFYGFSLFLITTPVYPLYPVDQQAILGIFLFAPSPAYFIGYLYFTLTRESRKLEREVIQAGSASNGSVFQKSAVRKNPIIKGKFVLPVLAILMILLLAGYLAFTAGVIFSSSYQSSPHASIVYIQEGPVYWQYSPQNIKVVIGVNNTVTWVSHSFTDDTVTSSNGSFTSDAIPPGGTYSYTFTQPGTYHYFCKYHLWMQGTVTVLASD